MQTNVAQFLVESAEGVGIEANIYEDYCGRNMFGGNTTGVEIVDGTPLDVMCAALNNIQFEIENEDLMEDIESLKLQSDQLGLNTIVY